VPWKRLVGVIVHDVSLGLNPLPEIPMLVPGTATLGVIVNSAVGVPTVKVPDPEVVPAVTVITYCPCAAPAGIVTDPAT